VDGANPIGYYDVRAGEFVHTGSIAGLPFEGTVLAAFSPDNKLYLANAQSNKLYRIRVGRRSIDASFPLVKASGAKLRVVGGDIAFDARGTLYLWTNSGGEGLYTISIPAVDGEAAVGTRLSQGIHPSYSGLAIRAAGNNGPLLVSSVTSDMIVAIDRTGGTEATFYSMYLDGNRFDHRFGDLTTGLLQVQRGEWCPPDYWLQHLDSWPTKHPTTARYNDLYRPALPGNPTLLEVLESPETYGIPATNAVADMLSAVHPDIDYRGDRIQDSCPLN